MRTLDEKTLDAAAQYFALEFMKPESIRSPKNKRWVSGPELVMQDFFNFHYKDEFDYMLTAIRGNLGPTQLSKFDEVSKGYFKPRSDKTLEILLRERLAVDLEGEHILGCIGTCQEGRRIVGHKHEAVTIKGENVIRSRNVYWNIYAGESEERIREAEVDSDAPSGHLGIVDPLPLHTPGGSVGAFATRISLNFAIAMADAGLLLLDEGSQGAVIEGRTTPRPSNVDDAVTGTLLFALNSDDATTFAGAADAGPGAIATAGTIDDDTSADNTATLLYCRASSANSLDTPLNDHLEGEAGTSGADFNFNTLAIVSGATVSLTSWTVTQPES